MFYPLRFPSTNPLKFSTRFAPITIKLSVFFLTEIFRIPVEISGEIPTNISIGTRTEIPVGIPNEISDDGCVPFENSDCLMEANQSFVYNSIHWLF